MKTVIVTGAGDQLGGLKGALVNSVVRHVRRAVPALRLPQAVRFNRALALGSRSPFADAPIAPDDLAFLQYTGGTTGVPKGAMLTHRNMVANLRQIYAWLAPAIEAEGEMFVAALPLYHVFALQVNGFVPLMIGASNLMIANPRDIPALVKALRGAPFTAIPGVNTLFNALLNNKDFAKLDFSRLHLAIGGGMAVQRAVAERWQSMTGKPLIEAYGLTETSPGGDRQSADHRPFHRRDRPADALDRHRHSRRRRPRPRARRSRRTCASRGRRSWRATGTGPTRPPR